MGKGTGTRPAMMKAEYLHAYYLANKKKLLAYRRAWYEANKPHVLAKQAKYEATHKEQVKIWAREGRKRRKDWLKRTPEERRAEYLRNREKIIARSRAWRAAHPGATWEQVKAWKAKNPEAYRLGKSLDRARRAGAERQRIHVEVLQDILRSQNGCCLYCGCLLEHFHIDHKLPLSRGGKHVKENLALACSTCNLRKNLKTAEEFMEMIQRETAIAVT